MKHLLITGICGFVGSTLAREFKSKYPELQITGIDNLSRPGSWTNKAPLQALGINIVHGDIRNPSDFETLPKCDWVIDAAANPSVLAGIDGKTSSYQLVQHNLIGTLNILEYCKKHNAGFTLLSTSRVYSISALANLQMDVNEGAFTPSLKQSFPQGISESGVDETCSTQPPVSLYGSTKVTSEHLALEYGETFGFPVWINRCGVMAGAGQFGHPAQGIFAYWIHSFVEQNPLKYIGFGGSGFQVRDCLHPKDLIPLLIKQFEEPLTTIKPRVINLSGGIKNSMSLKQLTDWCTTNIGPNLVEAANADRPFDIPWMVLDERKAKDVWDWSPKTQIQEVLEEIVAFAKTNNDWLKLSKQ